MKNTKQMLIQNAKGRKKYRESHSIGCCEICFYKFETASIPASKLLEVHHVIPVRLGGTNNPDNLILVCPNCHRLIHHVWIYNTTKRRCVTFPKTKKRLIKELREIYKKPEEHGVLTCDELFGHLTGGDYEYKHNV